MAVVVLAPGALSDLERLQAFLLETDPVAAERTIELILTGISIVRNHPLIGRPAEADLREIVISRGRSGYLALYRYDEATDRALVLAIRHQREAGYV